MDVHIEVYTIIASRPCMVSWYLCVTFVISLLYFQGLKLQENGNTNNYLSLFYKRKMKNHVLVIRTQNNSGFLNSINDTHRSPEKTVQITCDYIITLIKSRKKIIINFIRIYWFFIWTNLNPFIQECLELSFVEISPMVLEKMKMWKDYNNNDDGQWTNFDQKSSLEPSAQVSIK